MVDKTPAVAAVVASLIASQSALAMQVCTDWTKWRGVEAVYVEGEAGDAAPCRVSYFEIPENTAQIVAESATDSAVCADKYGLMMTAMKKETSFCLGESNVITSQLMYASDTLAITSPFIHDLLLNDINCRRGASPNSCDLIMGVYVAVGDLDGDSQKDAVIQIDRAESNASHFQAQGFIVMDIGKKNYVIRGAHFFGDRTQHYGEIQRISKGRLTVKFRDYEKHTSGVVEYQYKDGSLVLVSE